MCMRVVGGQSVSGLTLDGLLAHGGREARGPEVAGGDHGHVCEGRVQGPHALLLGDEPRHTAVHLVSVDGGEREIVRI